ncbi:monovalent cation:proton antiporter-2 (CPA2) family protein [Croceivirga sp. JEA036]|uniref:monovalent cation:proton antiporter-2 (CPA2) family protein n=1 Tax=Croceivirga sp. JEA036 TaxID=2721162 RepID=UPI00143B4B98|nr:monovalent cation:proton antiporter-2 (CPA2) family protein [Croceivirga sp. JEA036]NJB35333.1 potassium transporter [Croceivirga sp. JEA036]
MGAGILLQAIIFLLGAIIFVPLAKRLGLSSVLGYLIAGVVIGPFLFGFVGEEGQDILHFAEFGVVMMLFLIGLEIEPKSFWKMRKLITGMGGLQVGVTLAASFVLFYYIGFSTEVALTIAMAVALSSTAITLQTLKEKNLMDTTYGTSSFSILLFQDIIVIPMLAILPLLSSVEGVKANEDAHTNESLTMLDGLSLGWQTLAILGSIIAIIVAGRYLIVPMLRVVAKTRTQELLAAAALFIVLGISFLMEFVGLSPALGAFLGGVVLATSEFKHELESNLEPFKGLLLGLFFITVGVSINFTVIANNPVFIIAVVLAVIALKALVIFMVGRIFKLKLDQNLLLMLGLAQVGEFAFVLFSFAFQLEIIDQFTLDTMLVVTALSMALSPILSLLNERLVLPKVGTKKETKRTMDHIAKAHKVILVGFGHFGSTVGRFLRSFGVEATVLDHDSNRVDFLRKMGFEVYYGDATRMELLESAGIADAKLLICATGLPETNYKLVQMVKHKYTNLKIMTRAENRYDAYELLELGIDDIYRESLDTSVKLASDVLSFLGHRNYTVYRQAQNFIRYDEIGLRKLAQEPKDANEYVFKARKEIELQEKLLEEDWKRGLVSYDMHWNTDQMRASAVAKRKAKNQPENNRTDS